MNRVEQPGQYRVEPDGLAPNVSAQIGFDQLRTAALRQLRVIVACAALGLFGGLIYVMTAIPRYTASTAILIDGKKDKSDYSDSIAAITFDSSAIDSQVEVLKSEKIALSVISSMKLKKDPEFAHANSVVGQALALLPAALNPSQWFAARPKSEQEADSDLQRVIIGYLGKSLAVTRVPHTYVLTVEFTSPDPGKAALIANAFAEAYLNDQLDSKYSATRRASGWMQARITELKENSLASDSAVQKFKAEHGLVTSDGKLVSEQQMTQINSEAMLAHSETAKAEARYKQITDMLASGNTDGDVTDSLGSSTITDLRQKYLRASKTEAELEGKLGKDHLQVVSLRRDMSDYRRLMVEELRRIGETYRSDAEVARSKEASLKASMAKLVGENVGTNQTLVQLRELQSEADTYRSLYQAFLQRYQETIQQQTFPVSEARVITAASPPGVPSYPRRGVALSFSLLLGLLTGAGIGALRENRDRSFRIGAQIREDLDLEPLGMLPLVEHGVSKPTRTDTDAANDGQITPVDTIQSYSIDLPLSSFAETLRSIKVTLDVSNASRKPKIIGIVSCFPSEGKSTVSKNFASLLAHHGARTLLIDGDLRNPGLTRAVARFARAGLVEAIRGERPMAELLLSEPETGLMVLPAVVKGNLHFTSDLISSQAMQDLLTEAQKDFQYIIVDLPPLGPVVDVRAAASMFDAFVFVVEWGRTPRKTVQSILMAEPQVYEKCVGVVLNKVRMRQLSAYEGYGNKEYYHSGYSKYYKNDKRAY